MELIIGFDKGPQHGRNIVATHVIKKLLIHLLAEYIKSNL